jgi:DNA-directed RNA polymerase subunit N (RpoN/RPB10)
VGVSALRTVRYQVSTAAHGGEALDLLAVDRTCRRRRALTGLARLAPKIRAR